MQLMSLKSLQKGRKRAYNGVVHVPKDTIGDKSVILHKGISQA